MLYKLGDCSGKQPTDFLLLLVKLVSHAASLKEFPYSSPLKKITAAKETIIIHNHQLRSKMILTNAPLKGLCNLICAEQPAVTNGV